MKGRCQICNGHGYILDPRSNPHFRRKGRMPCPACKGEVAGVIRPHKPPQSERDLWERQRDD